MKKFLFRFFIGLAHRFATKPRDNEVSVDEAYSPQVAKHFPTKDLMATITSNVSVRKAMNGYVLELAAWQPTVGTGRHLGSTNNGDWKHTLYVVPEGQRIDEAVTALLVTQALDR
jgi:hypothetical protein